VNVIVTMHDDARYTALCRLYVFLNKWKWSETKINDEIIYKTHKRYQVEKKNFSTTAIRT